MLLLTKLTCEISGPFSLTVANVLVFVQPCSKTNCIGILEKLITTLKILKSSTRQNYRPKTGIVIASQIAVEERGRILGRKDGYRRRSEGVPWLVERPSWRLQIARV